MIERAEADLAREIERRRDDIGDQHGCLIVRPRERQQPFANADDAHVIAVDPAEAAGGRIRFVVFAAQQRDLLAIFARACESEAEISLEPLLCEIEIDQRAADPMGYERAGAGIGERDPEQHAGDDDGEAGQGEAGR